MKRYSQLRSVLITVSTLAFLGILGGSSQAGKTTAVLITVSGAINGSGSDPAAMAITFSGLDTQVNGSYIANPDRPLRLLGTGRTGRALTYYFCANKDHSGSVTRCNVTAHDPWDYKELIIRGGALAGTGQSVLAVFPVNSSWEIWRKQSQPGDPAQGVKEQWGQLTQSVTYQETPLR